MEGEDKRRNEEQTSSFRCLISTRQRSKKHGITKSETNRMVRGETEASRQQRKPKGDRSRRVRHERYRISAGDPKDR